MPDTQTPHVKTTEEKKLVEAPKSSFTFVVGRTYYTQNADELRVIARGGGTTKEGRANRRQRDTL